MMKLIAFILSYIAVWLRLLAPGGVRAVASENVLLRKQLLIMACHRKRTPRVTFFEKQVKLIPMSL